MRRFIAALIHALLIVLALTPAAQADAPKFYDVEVIVFQNIDPGIMDAEIWPTQVKLPTPTRFLSLDSLLSGASTTMGPPYQSYTPLDAADMRLNVATKLLVRSRHYRVLLHTGWRQPAADEKTALPIWINMTIPPGDAHSAPIDVDASGNTGQTTPSSATTAPDASAANPASGTPATPAPIAPPHLEGTIKFYVTRYMHFAVHLAYLTSRPAPPAPGPADGTAPAPDGAAPSAGTPLPVPANISASGMTAPNASAANGAAGGSANGRTPVVFYLDQERRVKKGELRYFDHPAFGVLVQVTPYTPPPRTSSKTPPQAATGPGH